MIGHTILNIIKRADLGIYQTNPQKLQLLLSYLNRVFFWYSFVEVDIFNIWISVIDEHNWISISAKWTTLVCEQKKKESCVEIVIIFKI